MVTLKELYQVALREAPSPFEAGELFRRVTGRSPVGLSGQAAAPGQADQLADLLSRRKQGYPLQYLLGEWEFYSLPFRVGPGVLIPRQDTETLVDAALALLEDLGDAPQVLDLCSGSGCVAVSIQKNCPQARVTAQEFSPGAFAFLEQNIRLNGVEVTASLSDLRAYTHPAPLDLAVSNPPYIPERDLRDLQTEVGYEPIVALDGGEDGLDYFRAIARRYREQLRPGGYLLLELGVGQGEALREILAEYGYRNIVFHRDLSGIDRVVQAQK